VYAVFDWMAEEDAQGAQVNLVKSLISRAAANGPKFAASRYGHTHRNGSGRAAQKGLRCTQKPSVVVPKMQSTADF